MPDNYDVQRQSTQSKTDAVSSIEKEIDDSVKPVAEQKESIDNTIERLKQLAELCKSGILAEEEFNQKKNDLLKKNLIKQSPR